MARYYVDTRAQPPRSSWEHPLGHQPPQGSLPGGYAPPPNPPPSRNYPSGGPPSYTGQPYVAQATQPQPYSAGGYQSNSQEPHAYSQPGYTPQQSYGGPPPGNYNQQQGWGQWQQPPPQQGTSYVTQSGRGSRHGGIGTAGTAVLGASDDSHRLHGADTDD